MKYIKFCKDKDIIILISRQLTKKQFYDIMMYIGSVKYGILDDNTLKAFVEDVNAR